MNKSFMEIQGRPILDLQLERIGTFILPELIRIVTDRAADYASRKLECIGDLPSSPSERSAMRGLHAALAQAPCEWVFVLANDMPWPNPTIAGAILQAVQKGGVKEHVRAGCISLNSGLEPMHAIYHRSLSDSLAERITEADRASSKENRNEWLSLRHWLDTEPGILKLSKEDLNTSQRELEFSLTNMNTAPRG